jgi:putative membrane protein insertion efficiency factor
MKNIIITICLILTNNFCYSQLISDKDLVLEKISYQEKEVNYYVHLENNNIIDYVFTRLFFVYKTFISSQDGSVCSFHPSCSEYGVISIKKFGLLEGVLNTSDRLLRCNGFSPEKYDFNLEENLLYDPSL